VIASQPKQTRSRFPWSSAALAAALVMLILQGCTGIPAPGKPQAPAFTLPSSDGESVSLSDYAGKQPVLLYFHMAVG